MADASNSSELPQQASSSQPPPGPRASRLQEVFGQALARTLRANSYANFSGCFPTPAKYVPASLESVWRQLNAKLEESARAEFDDIILERDVVRQLNELDRLVGEARLRRDDDNDNNAEGGTAAPHTLSPDELYRARLAPYLQEAQGAMNEKIDSTQSQNAELAQRIQSQRVEIESLLTGLESVVSDLEGAAVATSQFSKENDLRKEATQMEDETKARSEA